MNISYLVTMEQALNFLSNQGLDAASNENFENNVKLYRLAAHDKICQYLGYEVVQSTYTDERYDGMGGTKLFLKNRPITTLTTLKIDDVEQTVSDYEVIDERYLFNDAGFPVGQLALKITYTAGYTLASMPADIRLAALSLIALYTSKNGGAGTVIGLSSISDGAGGSSSIDFEAESRILDSLHEYQNIW